LSVEHERLVAEIEKLRGAVNAEMAGMRGSIDTLAAKVEASQSRHHQEITSLFERYGDVEKRVRTVEQSYVPQSAFGPVANDVKNLQVDSVRRDDFVSLRTEFGEMKTQVTRLVAAAGFVVAAIQLAVKFL